MKPKISLKELPRYIKKKNDVFKKEMSDNGGGSYHCRALVAHCLLLLSYYSFSINLVPINGVFNAHAFLASSWVIVLIIWGVIKNKIYPWIQEFISGEIFYTLDYISLNISIAALCLVNIAFFIPINPNATKDSN